MVTRLGLSAITTGKLLAEEALNRLMLMSEVVHDIVRESSKGIRKNLYARYKEFLKSELQRLESMEGAEEIEEEPEKEREQ